jgi:hypothetical protein
MSTVSPDKARDLQARFGSSLRAIAGNVKRNGAPTNPPYKMPVPPPAPTAPLPAPPAGRSEEEIPF